MTTNARLVSAAEAARELDVPAGSIRRWKSSRRLFEAGLDEGGRPLYWLHEVAALAAATRRRRRS